MRNFPKSSAALTAVLSAALMLTACANRSDGDDAPNESQLASETTICDVSADNHSSALCYRVGDSDEVTLSQTRYSGAISGYRTDEGLSQIKLELADNAELTLQAMASGLGEFPTYHEGMSSSVYVTTTGEYYTQTASSEEDGGTITFTTYDDTPGGRMAGHFDVNLCQYSMSTHVVDCENHMIQLIGAFDVGVAAPVCTVAPEGSDSALCYQVDSNPVQQISSDNQSLVDAYFETYDNTTRLSLVPTRYDGELTLRTAGAAVGEWDLSTSGNSFYDNGTGYVRSSSDDVDGGTVTFTEYGANGERVKGHFAANLCQYGYNPLTGAGQHGAIDCDDNATIWIRGAFDLLRSADRYTQPGGYGG